MLFLLWFWAVLLLLVASHSPRKVHCWTYQVHYLTGLESKEIFISCIKLRGTSSSPLPLMSAERECSPQPKNTWVFCSVNCPLLARFWGASDPFYFLPVPLYGFWSIWDLGSLLWCVVVFYCWYVEQIFWGPFRANTIMFGCSGPSLVSQELPSRPAGPCFLHPFFQMHRPYFPRKPLDSALHEGNYTPLHTFGPKCLWCRDCGLQNLWGTDLSFSLAMYLAYSTVRH